MPSTIFHHAAVVTDLNASRDFYTGLLGCAEAASAASWVDFDFFGHQLSVHLCSADTLPAPVATGTVDGISVPLPHFGAVLSLTQWQALAERLQAAQVAFVVPPGLRYAGQPGEQWTLFLLDPSGNALEFKALSDATELFER